VDHPLRLDRVELAVRPWRTATVAVALVAAAELVALLVIGGAWLAKPDPSAPAVRAKTTTKAVASTPAPRAAQAKLATRAKVAPVDLPRRNVKVVVLNGNGRQGAAAAAASRVSRRGYRIGVVANAPSHDYPRSIVMYRSGFAAEGRRLARDLGVPIVSPLDGLRPGQLGGAHAVLILGT
jgi:LytR cell envelope-related transcriptional attenuator